MGLRWLLEQPQCRLDRPVRVEVPPGASLRQVVRQLQAAGVVRRPWLLQGLFRWYRTDRQVRAGLYEFRGTLSTWDLYRQLLEGHYIVRTLTIVEGWDRFDVARYLEEQGLAPRSVTLQRMADASRVTWIRDLDPEAPDLEGYLYPSTYEVFANATLDEVLFRAVQTFRRQWRPEWTERAHQMGLTVRQVVTLASLIEKETPRPEERPMVSAVYHNRLRHGMRLECDPTVIYAWRWLGITPVPLTRADMDIDSPYNTYRYAGLPPGPIANPSRASLEAALYPSDGDWLYFVADGRGGHRFARTYAEHLRNVRLYREPQALGHRQVGRHHARQVADP
jgi:UPF0755 protein